MPLRCEKPQNRCVNNCNTGVPVGNKAFIDIRLRPGIATPPEEDRAMATRDLHNKFRDDQSSGSRDMLADRQTDRQTHEMIAILCSPTEAECEK